MATKGKSTLMEQARRMTGAVAQARSGGDQTSGRLPVSASFERSGPLPSERTTHPAVQHTDVSVRREGWAMATTDQSTLMEQARRMTGAREPIRRGDGWTPGSIAVAASLDRSSRLPSQRATNRAAQRTDVSLLRASASKWLPQRESLRSTTTEQRDSRHSPNAVPQPQAFNSDLFAADRHDDESVVFPRVTARMSRSPNTPQYYRPFFHESWTLDRYPWGHRAPPPGAEFDTILDLLTAFGEHELGTLAELFDAAAELVENVAEGWEQIVWAVTVGEAFIAAASVVLGALFPNEFPGVIQSLFGVTFEFEPLALGLGWLRSEWFELFGAVFSGEIGFVEFLGGLVQSTRQFIVAVAQYVWGLVSAVFTSPGVWGPVAVVLGIAIVLFALAVALRLTGRLLRWLKSVLGLGGDNEEEASEEDDTPDLGWMGDVPVGLDAYTTGTGLPPWAHRIAFVCFALLSEYHRHPVAYA